MRLKLPQIFIKSSRNMASNVINAVGATGDKLPLIQYVVVRSDLISDLKWPLGAVIAQACHAVTATTHLFYDDESTKQYLNDLDNMHKCVLQAKNEQAILTLCEQLKEADIKHKLWIEQPENIPTCLVVKPYPKNEVQKYFKKFQLFK